LDELNVEEGRVDVVFHCYGSDLSFAEKLWERGYYTSFTGIVTYPSAVNLHEVVGVMPLDKFMIETDCPYLAPQKYRGKRNEPSYVVEVAEKIAELKGVSLSEIEDRSTENALKFFKGLSS
jgi:TatD DNase family protein